MASNDSTRPDSSVVRLGNKLGKAFEQLQDRIRERAYHIFQSRGSDGGDPMADWLEAQRELLAPVDLVLKEQKKNIVVEGHLQGFKPKEVEVEVGSHEVKVFGSHCEVNRSKKSGEAQLSSQAVNFYQVISLPCEVDAAAGEATLLKNGKLKIILPRKLDSRQAA